MKAAMKVAMKSIVNHGPRDLRIGEQAVTPPGPGEVQITMAAGGIRGSDLHYYNHGAFGTVRLREPMVPKRSRASTARRQDVMR